MNANKKENFILTQLFDGPHKSTALAHLKGCAKGVHFKIILFILTKKIIFKLSAHHGLRRRCLSLLYYNNGSDVAEERCGNSTTRYTPCFISSDDCWGVGKRNSTCVVRSSALLHKKYSVDLMQFFHFVLWIPSAWITCLGRTLFFKQATASAWFGATSE